MTPDTLAALLGDLRRDCRLMPDSEALHLFAGKVQALPPGSRPPALLIAQWLAAGHRNGRNLTDMAADAQLLLHILRHPTPDPDHR